MDDESKSSFQKILFTEPRSGETIKLISVTQCEVADKDAIHLADYSIEKDAMEGNKLRIVTKVGGNDTVSYLAIRPAGLISLKERKVFLFAAILNKLRKTCPMDAYAECLESDFDRFYVALENYKLNFLNYPSSHQGLNALLEKQRSNPHYWMPMTNIPFDPWGSPYRYQLPGKKQTKPEIISNGPDRKECTTDDISSQDISINIEATRKSFYHPSAMQEKIVGFWELGGDNWQLVAHFENNGTVTLTEKDSHMWNDNVQSQPEPVSGTYTIEAGPYTNLSPGLFGQVAKLKLHPTNQLNRWSGGLSDNELIVLWDLIDNSLARVIPVLPERVHAMERLRYDDQKTYLWRRIEKN